MCGIAGFADAPSVTSTFDLAAGESLIRSMCDVIRHRGPDDEGWLVEAGVALGMRRLSIIDVASGHQPIHNEDGSVSIVFNGEIYNFRQLRAQLIADGHQFSTFSDTEVIVHAYEQWGADAVARLRGMFGLAIWDRRTRTLLVARDRIGIKPMHYAEVKGRLYFGSELKSLLCAPDLPRDLDPQSLDHFLTFLYTPRDRSIFTGVRKLPPGHLLIWRGGRLRVERYWSLPAQEGFSGSEDEAVEQLREVLTDAVRSHLMSDVPLGAFLSGGVDSSVVVALMAEASSRPVKTFAIGFEDPAYDERAYARLVAEHLGTEHHELVVRPDGLAILDALVSHFDEPFGDASAIPTWYVSELARRHVTVVLSGDGGDELFGGYERYVPQSRVAAFDRYSPSWLRPLAGLAADAMPASFRGRNFLHHLAQGARDRYIDDIRFFGAGDRASLLTPDVRRARGRFDAEAELARHFEPYAGLPWPSQMMRFDADTYLPEDVLTKVDRMSMAHSIESRVPLLDNEVIRFASSLPSAYKIGGGRQKHVLKRMASALLPASILNRRKQGFGVPLDVWFRGQLTELFADTLLAQSSLQRGYFQPGFIRTLVDEHVTGRRDHALRLWQLVVFERWLRQYVDDRDGKPLPFSATSVPRDAAMAAS